MGALQDSEINTAKEVLAWEITRQVHGQQAADEAKAAAQALFGGGKDDSSMPTTEMTREELAQNAKVYDLLMACGLTKSKGEGRKLIKGGGVSVNGEKVTDEFREIGDADIQDGAVMLKKGKKVFHKIVVR